MGDRTCGDTRLEVEVRHRIPASSTTSEPSMTNVLGLGLNEPLIRRSAQLIWLPRWAESIGLGVTATRFGAALKSS
jgi:hypothetical protein